MAGEVELRFGRFDLLGELEPLWLSLFDHHVALGAAGLPVVRRDRSWPLRRQFYEKLLAEPDAFILVAYRASAAVGYVMAHIHDGADDTWPTGDRFGEVESLVLMPDERARGLGGRMLDAAERRLADLGAHTVVLHALIGNDDAIRFYERRGMVPISVELMRLGPKP